MKVKDLIKKCGVASTVFQFKVCNEIIREITARTTEKSEPDFLNRTVNTYRVKNGYMEVYLKPLITEVCG